MRDFSTPLPIIAVADDESSDDNTDGFAHNDNNAAAVGQIDIQLQRYVVYSVT